MKRNNFIVPSFFHDNHTCIYQLDFLIRKKWKTCVRVLPATDFSCFPIVVRRIVSLVCRCRRDGLVVFFNFLRLITEYAKLFCYFNISPVRNVKHNTRPMRLPVSIYILVYMFYGQKSKSENLRNAHENRELPTVLGQNIIFRLMSGQTYKCRRCSRDQQHWGKIV